MTFQKGQSGNPAGRRALSVEVREQIHKNAEKGVERLRQLLDDDEAWGKDGWMSGKEQIALAALSMDRGFGRAENVSVTHTHSGTVGLNVSNRLKDVAERLPERIAHQRVVEGRAEELLKDE